MKIVSIIARYLLGLMFTVFGLNGFLSFIHQPPPINPLALQFFGAIIASHFAAYFFAVQLIGGLLLISGFFVPLALTLLAAELYNILAFHLTLAPASITPARRYYFSQHEEYNPGAEHCLVIGPYGHIGAQYGRFGLLGNSVTSLSGLKLDPVAVLDLTDLRYQWFDYVFKDAPRPDCSRTE